MHDYKHSYDPLRGQHRVGTAGEVPMAFYFAARKHGALNLRIGDTYIAQINFTGNLSARIERARELLMSFTCDAGVLRDVVDSAIAQATRKASDFREQAQRQEDRAQFMCSLEL